MKMHKILMNNINASENTIINFILTDNSIASCKLDKIIQIAENVFDGNNYYNYFINDINFKKINKTTYKVIRPIDDFYVELSCEY